MKLINAVLVALALVGFSTASWAGCSYHDAKITYTPAEDKDAVTAAPATNDEDQPLVADVQKPQETDTAN